MEGATDNLILLLARELVEVNGIARYTNGQIGVQFGIFHCVNQFLTIENVDIDVMCVAVKIATEDVNKIFDALLVRFSKRLGNDGKGVGNIL